VVGTVGRLHVEAAVRPALVVADVLFQDVLGMTLSPNDDVVEAVSAERADHPFGERVGEGRRLHLMGRIRREPFG
jgi:hypothetical protein